MPSHFSETAQRMVDHFHILLDLLAYPAQPMGLSQVDFERWLPKAVKAVDKARAIIEERRDPDQSAGPEESS